jgi:hypothetical protein
MNDAVPPHASSMRIPLIIKSLCSLRFWFEVTRLYGTNATLEKASILMKFL